MGNEVNTLSKDLEGNLFLYQFCNFAFAQVVSSPRISMILSAEYPNILVRCDSITFQVKEAFEVQTFLTFCFSKDLPLPEF
jgi:hypothetical protein